jgi:hypothetical protein
MDVCLYNSGRQPSNNNKDFFRSKRRGQLILANQKRPGLNAPFCRHNNNSFLFFAYTAMPRTSARKKEIRELEKQLAERIDRARARELLDDHDPVEDEMDEYVFVQLIHKQSQRYTTRKPK